MNESCWELLWQIHQSSLQAMRLVADSDTSENHNDSYFDLKIGQATTQLAYSMYKGKVPELVEKFLKQHHEDESLDAKMFQPYKRNQMADIIAAHHQKVLKEHGLISYFACMPLFGERMSLAEAHYHCYSDDPHATKEGFIREFWHCTTPLILIPMLEPTEDELRQALADQAVFIERLKSSFKARKGEQRQ
jgi:hypothetical protein